MLPHGQHPRAGKSPASVPSLADKMEGHSGSGGGAGFGAMATRGGVGPGLVTQFMSPPGRPGPSTAEAESAIKLRQATEIKIQETEAGLRRLLLLHTVLTNIDSSSPVPATPSPPPMVVDDDDDDDRWVNSPPSPGPKPSAAALRAVSPPRLVLPSGAGAAAAALAAQVQVEVTGGSGGRHTTGDKKRAAADLGEADLGEAGTLMQVGGTEAPAQMAISPAGGGTAKLHPGSPDFGFADANGIFGGPSIGGGWGLASTGAIATAGGPADSAAATVGSPMKKRKTFALVPSSSMPAAAGLAIPTFGGPSS